MSQGGGVAAILINFLSNVTFEGGPWTNYSILCLESRLEEGHWQINQFYVYVPDTNSVIEINKFGFFGIAPTTLYSIKRCERSAARGREARERPPRASSIGPTNSRGSSRGGPSSAPRRCLGAIRCTKNKFYVFEDLIKSMSRIDYN